MAGYRRVYDLRHLQADCKNWDQLRNPMFGNQGWATFTFFTDRGKSNWNAAVSVSFNESIWSKVP